jgi:diadenylate cyclase
MELLSQIRWLDILDILIVSFMAYRLWVWMRGTRALQILVGLLALGVISLLAVRYQLSTTAWIFSNLWTVLLLLILIVFQPELRRMLERVSPLKLLTGRPAEEVDRSLAEVRDAAFKLGAARIGALMAIAREDPVEEHLTDGIPLDGRVSRQVLVSLFQRESPVHDGAALIRGDRIVSVGNYLPLTDRAGLPSHLGTRHRSALGLSETCDAVVVVVSEERGEVAIARAGHLTSCADSATLEAELRTLIRPADAPSVEGRRFFRALTRDPIGKLGALVFAGVLWGLFAAPVDYQRIIPQVPIDYRFPEHAAAVGDLPQRAEVMVTGSQMSLGRLRPDEISVSVDLASLGKGTHGVNLTDAAVIVPPGVRVVTIQPLRIEVSLDVVETRSFAVAVRKRGDLGPGWTLREMSAEPEEVELTGLSSELDRVSWVETETVDLAGKEGSWVGLMAVTVQPEGIELRSVDPPEVEVRVEVSREGEGEVEPPS